MTAEKVDAIVLAGGLGTRLQAVVNDRPKPLAPVRGRPFLDYIFRFLQKEGVVRRAVLAIGYRAGQIEAEYCNRTDFGFPFLFSVEDRPLGTGGAIRKAMARTEGDTLLVLNGDSFVDCGLKPLLAFHHEQGADMTVAVREEDDVARYGSVTMEKGGRITHFSEKGSAAGRGFINAGIYALERRLFQTVPAETKISLEHDLMPGFAAGRIFGFKTEGGFIDIGLPETYTSAEHFLDSYFPDVN